MTPQELFTSPEGINWKLLSEQKQTLIAVMYQQDNDGNKEQAEALDGILNVLDTIQDLAVNYYGLEEGLVFNLSND